MPDNIETEIRKALDAKAHEVDVPEGLAARTVEFARESQASSFRGRVRAWRDGRGSRGRITGYPRMLYAGAAAATAVLLFVVGAVVTRPTGVVEQPAVMEAKPMEDAGPGGGGGTTGSSSGVVMDQPMMDSPADTDASRNSGADTGAPYSGPESKVSGDSSGAATTAIAPVPPVPGPGTGKFPPKIVRTANVEVEVKSFGSAWNRANSIAQRYGGFVTNSNTEQVKDRLGRGSLVMRVPSAKLDAALADLRKLGTLSNMSTSGDDISAPIADVKARIKTLETQELQLLDLMRRANTLSETLEVRSQLDSVRQEIESYKAQRDVYENQVAYSTINATIFEKGIDPNDGDGGNGILRDAIETALRVGLTIVAGALVVLGGLIPLAALGLAIWFIVRAARRRRTA